MTEQDYEARYEPRPAALDEARAELEQYLETGDARTALERFEAAVRANERGGTTFAANLHLAAVDLMEADPGPRPGHSNDYCRGWDDATHRAASYLRGRADQAQR